MNKIEKFLKKISSKESIVLEDKIFDLMCGKLADLNIIKIQGTSFYRIKVGRYRIIFYYMDTKIVIKDIRLRNENTYKKL